MLKNIFITLLTISAFIINGCSETEWKPTSHIVFIDYTSSCDAMDDFNRRFVKKQILNIAVKMQRQDELKIYPIHASTLSASAIEVIHYPKLLGDLNDNIRIDNWKKEVTKNIDNVIHYQFSDADIAGTNVFATIQKAKMTLKTGKDVKLYYISDMLHEMAGKESFKELFPKMKENEIRVLANDKASKYCPNNMLTNVSVNVFLPGKPNGTKYDDLYQKIYCFWDEFFTSAGTNSKIQELRS